MADNTSDLTSQVNHLKFKISALESQRNSAENSAAELWCQVQELQDSIKTLASLLNKSQQEASAAKEKIEALSTPRLESPKAEEVVLPAKGKKKSE